MEKVLQKLARQLNAYDEASLMSLWDKYAAIVSNFEPTKRWEEAALVFGFIQSLRWKNQLFNYNWSERSRPGGEPPLPPVDPFLDILEADSSDSSKDGPVSGDVADKRAKVLRFRPRQDDETT